MCQCILYPPPHWGSPGDNTVLTPYLGSFFVASDLLLDKRREAETLWPMSLRYRETKANHIMPQTTTGEREVTNLEIRSPQLSVASHECGPLIA